MAGSQVLIALSQLEKQRLGYQAISLTNFAAATEPQIAAGSKVEIGGALFEFTAPEAITGWAGIGINNNVYIKLTVAGAAVTASFTTTPPTWSESKQGFYDALERYIGGLYKDAGGNYARKYVFGKHYENNQALKIYGSGAVEIIGGLILDPTNGQPGWLCKRFEMGVWNMDLTGSLSFTMATLGLTLSKIRHFNAIVRDDAGTGKYRIEFDTAGDIYIDGSILYIRRDNGMFFDSVDFDSVAFNRGWFEIWYDPNG